MKYTYSPCRISLCSSYLAENYFMVAQALDRFLEAIQVVESLNASSEQTSRMRQKIFKASFYPLTDIRAILFNDGTVQYKTPVDAQEPKTQIWPIWDLDSYGQAISEKMGYSWTARFLPPETNIA